MLPYAADKLLVVFGNFLQLLALLILVVNNLVEYWELDIYLLIVVVAPVDTVENLDLTL